MIVFSAQNTTFNDVIKIRDTFGTNSFLRTLNSEDHQKLNSIFLHHMFARTENPSDSKISQQYLARVHETSSILLGLAKVIHLNEFTEVENEEPNVNDLSDVVKRMKNLIGLINAEKFNFEDLDAWRMGSLMDRRFRDHWKIRSDELNNFRIDCKQKIDAGIIEALGELFELIDTNQNKIIGEEETTIKSINEAELENYYKLKLFQQLRDQIENHSRDMRNTLERDFKRHHHKIEKETGKFSQNVLEKKILDTIERMDPSDQCNDESQLDATFEFFWKSEDVIGSAELQQLKTDNAKSYKQQRTVIRQNIKQAFEAAFELEMYDVAVKQEFPDLDSLENWDFMEEELLAIEVMNDKTYFKVGLRRQLQKFNPFSYSNYDFCMPQIHSRFIELIDQNPYTARNYDGDVDFTKIRELCISFQNAVQKVTDEHGITKAGFRTDN